MDRKEIESASLEYGGTWGYQHSKRLLKLIDIIGEGQEYNNDVIWYSSYLHDWGAYRYNIVSIEHAYRSRELAEEILPNTDLIMMRVLDITDSFDECSMNTDFRDTNLN